MGTLLTVLSDSSLDSVANLVPSDYVAVAIRGERPYNKGAALIEELRDYFLQEPYDEMNNEEILERFDSLKEENRQRIRRKYSFLMAQAIAMGASFDDLDELDFLGNKN